jgi:hypothetical protein
MMEGLSAESDEKREPASDVSAAVVSLKALDLSRPIREADIGTAIELLVSTALTIDCIKVFAPRTVENTGCDL